MKPSLAELSHIPIFKALSETQFQTLIDEAQLVSLTRTIVVHPQLQRRNYGKFLLTNIKSRGLSEIHA